MKKWRKCSNCNLHYESIFLYWGNTDPNPKKCTYCDGDLIDSDQPSNKTFVDHLKWKDKFKRQV